MQAKFLLKNKPDKSTPISTAVESRDRVTRRLYNNIVC